jgi:hypothetical protein
VQSTMLVYLGNNNKMIVTAVHQDDYYHQILIGGEVGRRGITDHIVAHINDREKWMNNHTGYVLVHFEYDINEKEIGSSTYRTQYFDVHVMNATEKTLQIVLQSMVSQ